MKTSVKTKKTAHPGGEKCLFAECGNPAKKKPAGTSLKDFVDAYVNYYREHIINVQVIFTECDFETAVKHAGLSTCPICGSVYMHQHRLSLKPRKDFSRQLLDKMQLLRNAGNFEELWEICRDIAD